MPQAVADAAAAGTSLVFAHRDHVHGREAFGGAGYPIDIAGTEVDGVATTLPRSDHVHRGVHVVKKSGGADIYGDITLSEGANVTLTQSSNDIAVAAVLDDVLALAYAVAL